MKCNSKCKTSQRKKTASSSNYGMIDTEGVDVLIRSKTPTVILDARLTEWDDGKRIPGAKLLTADDAAKHAAKNIPSKKSLVVVYCSNPHCPASSHLADELLELGYSNILKYEAGIEGWLKAGKPVEKKKVKQR